MNVSAGDQYWDFWLLLPEVASQQGMAVLIHPVGEELASDADAAALPSLQLPLVDKTPALYADFA